MKVQSLGNALIIAALTITACAVYSANKAATNLAWAPERDPEIPRLLKERRDLAEQGYQVESERSN